MDDREQDVIREFLLESSENLSRLDQELIELEKQPDDSARLASIFRTFHTIKGTCGFLGFSTLEKITHQAENLLSQLREGQRQLNPSLVSLILEIVDATRTVLSCIEGTGTEGSEHFDGLIERLQLCAQDETQISSPPANEPVPFATQRDAAVTAASPGVATDHDNLARTSSVAGSTIRVPVALLDKLMDLVGELVLTRNQVLQLSAQREDHPFIETAQRLSLITAELQQRVMKTRMQPIGTLWNKLPRMVRDLAMSLGKQIRLELIGAETELDRTILEAIKDPLLHLVRNACDHGIETPEARLFRREAHSGSAPLAFLSSGRTGEHRDRR